LFTLAYRIGMCTSRAPGCPGASVVDICIFITMQSRRGGNAGLIPIGVVYSWIAVV
jgi:hypothetical protein